MTRTDLIEAVHQRTGRTKLECDRIVHQVLDAMKETLAAGEPVRISGFGKFTVRRKTARAGRNPQTGAAIDITARKVVTFKPSEILRATVRTAASEGVPRDVDR